MKTKLLFVFKMRDFFGVFLNFRDKLDIFNIRLVSYSVSLQPNIGKIISKWSLKFFRFFWLFIRLVWLNIITKID
jgi:hypothetical protein